MAEEGSVPSTAKRPKRTDLFEVRWSAAVLCFQEVSATHA
jgi:hypothetical protein